MGVSERKFFQAIRQCNTELVTEMLDQYPGLVSSTVKQPPKKENGQSPLQIALQYCNGDFTIPNVLLDKGADVNFIAEENGYSRWRAPASHDAIRAAVLYSRWVARKPSGEHDEYGGIVWAFPLQNTKETSDAAFAFLKRVFQNDGDITAHDSYGTSCIGRAITTAEEILPRWKWQDRCLSREKPLNNELVHDLTRIFDYLLQCGADADEYIENLSQTYHEKMNNSAISAFYTL